jgi:hypothetical protein
MNRIEEIRSRIKTLKDPQAKEDILYLLAALQVALNQDNQ